MTAKEMSMDEYLTHSTSGAGTTFLRKWRKRQPPVVNTWMHTKCGIIALWQHAWYQLRAWEDKDTGEARREVWGFSFNCLEHEKVLKDQYKRDENDDRVMPPQVCPMCLLIEAVREKVRAGELQLVQPIFKFYANEDDADDDCIIITAGGIYNAFSDDDLSADVKRAMKRAGLRGDEVWKQNAQSKCNYLFRVVDNDHPESGVQVAIETTLLGDKVKTVIRDTITSMGTNDGNPVKNPYCIQWQHRPAEKEFSKKYHAVKMDKIPLTDAVRELIYDEDPPDVSRIIAPGNVRLLRAQFEKYALVDFDWDAIFAAAEKLQGEDEDEDTSFPPAEESAAVITAAKPEAPKEQPKEAPAAGGRRRKKEEAPPKPVEPQVEMIPCDDCKKPMRADATKCPNCGAEYSFDEAQAAPPPKANGKPAAAKAPAAKSGKQDEDDLPW